MRVSIRVGRLDATGHTATEHVGVTPVGVPQHRPVLVDAAVSIRVGRLDAVGHTATEHVGVTPVGVPQHWPVLVDAAVAAGPRVVVGSGVRRSKLTLPGDVLGLLPAR